MKFRVTSTVSADCEASNKEEAMDLFKEAIEVGLETANEIYTHTEFTGLSALPKFKKFIVTMRWEKAYTVEAANADAAENEASHRADEDDAEVRTVAQSPRTTLHTEETDKP